MMTTHIGMIPSVKLHLFLRLPKVLRLFRFIANLGLPSCAVCFKKIWGAHQINKKIVSYALTDPIVNNEKVKKAYYIVVTLNFKEKKADVISFKEFEYHLAFKEYRTREQNNPRTEQTVLIALSQINKIREAYPNYFMNLSNFLSIIDFILTKNKKRVKYR